MTRARLGKITAEWTKRLRLTPWNIQLNFDTPAPEHADAYVWTHDTYKVAEIRFAPTWSEWPPLVANQIIAHELMHVVTRDIDVATKRARQELPEELQAVLRDWYKVALETAIDQTAEVLVELGGCV